jgi:hypothetical protein
MTRAEFEAELERLAQAELPGLARLLVQARELEAAKTEAAEALLDADTAAARRKFSEATQALALLEASLDAARHRRESCSRLTARPAWPSFALARASYKNRQNSLTLSGEKFCRNRKTRRRKIFRPAPHEYDAPRKSDLLRAKRKTYSLPRRGLSRPASRAQAWPTEVTLRSYSQTCSRRLPSRPHARQ